MMGVHVTLDKQMMKLETEDGWGADRKGLGDSGFSRGKEPSGHLNIKRAVVWKYLRKS